MESRFSPENMNQPSGVRENPFSKELTNNVWTITFGKGLVGGRVQKIERTFGKPDRVLMTAITRVQFIKPEGENGMIAWKSQDQPGMVTLKVDSAERMVVEKDTETGRNKAIIYKGVGKQTKSGSIKYVLWRFSPLKSK